ncbi:PREDICTED: glycerol-3-phosphate dehydrogenase, mitochondrial-like [Cyprinodon variegatus]|uniref:glycerol-3-phosphate dehydrogenase, mitochondrial-like n=1 Tax=Cyprinodon variegatus TaxID=28743 RepID=UPI000742B934|nr:PREDICTED: glycerol-3-phosphate dehydrogenase, mitochondrial-like [Cyprinodon variegatus]
MAFRKALRRTAVVGGGVVAAGFGLSQFLEYRRTQPGLARLAHVAAEAELKVPFADELPSRETQLATLRDTPEFDVLVVGGGATGAGCALDAVTRNLKTALVERSDFSSGTSSRSTKLIHGGVRYLQKAIMQLDYEQYMMVKEALHERANLLEIAPHLSAPLPIMLPVYKWWQLPYYWAGIKMYDLVAGIYCLKSSYVLTKSKALEHFPMLKKDKLVGAIVYYDDILIKWTQLVHDDSFLCVIVFISLQVAQHLASTYGGKAFDVAKMAKVTGQRWPIVGKRLVSEFPYIEAEVLYAIKEYACTAIDVIARRTRLGFLNVQAADEALPRIVHIMGKELNWSQEKRTEELEAAKKFLYHEMGYRSRSEQLTKTSEINLDYQEVVKYKNRFHKFDKESKGFITTVDVQRVLGSINVHIDENALHEILNEVDLNKNGQVEIDEFLQLMSAVKKGHVSDSRLAILMKTAEETLEQRGPVTVDRSGGGV